MPPNVGADLSQEMPDAAEIERHILNRDSPNNKKMQRFKLNKDNLHATVISSEEYRSAELEAKATKVSECVRSNTDHDFDLD